MVLCFSVGDLCLKTLDGLCCYGASLHLGCLGFVLHLGKSGGLGQLFPLLCGPFCTRHGVEV